jgi:lipopolysaccharide export system protein LptA
MKKIIYISIILIVILLLFSYAYATTYLVKDKDGNTVRITSQFSLSLEEKEAGYTITVFGKESTSSIEEDITNNTPGGDVNLPSIDLIESNQKLVEITDLNNRLSESKKYIYVEGVLINCGNKIVDQIIVTVKSLNLKGEVVSIDNGLADPSILAPGQKASFQIMVKNDNRIKKFSSSVNYEICKNGVPLKEEYKIKIVDWNNRPSTSGNYIYVEGSLKNIGDQTAERVRVKVKSLGSNGEIVSIDDGYADPSSIAPNKEGMFQIMVENNYKIKKFSLLILTKSTISTEVIGVKEKPLAKQIININTASLEELMYVLEINENTAMRVINRRNDMKRFKNPKDIMLLIEIGKIKWEEWIKRGIVIIV